MFWKNEQDRIVREGRLYSAPPEMVFAELKELSGRNRSEMLSSKTEALETLLVERNDPLINLGLACYGTNKHVFTALYKHSLEPARDIADGLYKRNLRMGCLSNQTITTANVMFDFPRDVLGEHEIFRIFSEADKLELEAMVSNPTVSDKLLEEIFSMAGVMPHSRTNAGSPWCIMLSASTLMRIATTAQIWGTTAFTKLYSASWKSLPSSLDGSGSSTTFSAA